MAKKVETKRAMVDFCDGIDTKKGATLTGADIAAAYKASLLDFVRGEASRGSVATVSTLLKGALDSRKQELAELDDLSSQRVGNFY